MLVGWSSVEGDVDLTDLERYCRRILSQTPHLA